ncbi:MAG: RNA polymerase [Thermoplasmata archaeon]|nr:RNA polymerase [Thermoplasmata archaeon]
MTEEHLTLAEIKELLQKEQKIRELTMEQKYALEHSEKFAKLKAKEAKKFVKELVKIEQVTEGIACKLVDLMPRYPEEVRAVFSKERAVTTEETIKEILDQVSKYL